MEKLPRVKPWIIRDEELSVDDGEYLQTPEELDAYKQFSMCINCMLCYAACPVYGLDPDFVGPAAIALAERYDLDSRDQGARERLDVLIEHEGVWGCTFVGECTRVCPKHVDPAGAIQRYKLKAAQESVKAFLLPRGAPMSRHAVDDLALPAADLDLVVDPQAHLLRVRDARAEQHLHRLVRGVPAAARAGGRARRGGVRRLPRLGRVAVVVVLNVVASRSWCCTRSTWFSLTPQAMVVRVRGRRVPPRRSSGRSTSGSRWCPRSSSGW